MARIRKIDIEATIAGADLRTMTPCELEDEVGMVNIIMKAEADTDFLHRLVLFIKAELKVIET